MSNKLQTLLKNKGSIVTMCSDFNEGLLLCDCPAECARVAGVTRRRLFDVSVCVPLGGGRHDIVGNRSIWRASPSILVQSSSFPVELARPYGGKTLRWQNIEQYHRKITFWCDINQLSITSGIQPVVLIQN